MDDFLLNLDLEILSFVPDEISQKTIFWPSRRGRLVPIFLGFYVVRFLTFTVELQWWNILPNDFYSHFLELLGP